MKAKLSWTPLGCGPYNSSYPDFPRDLVPRLEHLDLGVEAVFLAWEIGRLASKETDPGQQRAVMLLALALQLISAEGSTRLPLKPGGQLERILKEFNTTAEERAAVFELLGDGQQGCSALSGPSLTSIFGSSGDYRPLIIDHGCLYMQKMHVLEARVGENLRLLMESCAATLQSAGELQGVDEATGRALKEVFNSPPVMSFGKAVLDEEQKKAVEVALKGRIAVVSGRPGSGKTSIVASVLRVLARVGDPPLESMVLAAPTGKAADGMRQSVANHLSAIPDGTEADRRLAAACPPSLTLHRLLGYSPGQDRFRHHENNPLSERLVIVDESSMVDLAMMDRLLRALRPDGRVVFLGDADQLPSVETGAVLRDLCRSGTANKLGRVVVLLKSYRAREDDPRGKSILNTAATINVGMLPEAKSLPTRQKAAELLFAGVEQLKVEDENQLFTFYTRWLGLLRGHLSGLAERLSREYPYSSLGFSDETAKALKNILDHYEKFRILCVTRVAAGGTGSEAVNAYFHRSWSEELQAAAGGSASSQFLVGEPVLVTRNEYNLGLYNGDSGLVLMVKPPDEVRPRAAEPMAVFPRRGGYAAYPLEALRGRLELAWATTVHKAQGSEYDYVSIILPGADVRPLTRELLYTAVTRAKKSVVFVGSPEALAAGIKRKMERTSGLADMLD